MSLSVLCPRFLHIQVIYLSTWSLPFILINNHDRVIFLQQHSERKSGKEERDEKGQREETPEKHCPSLDDLFSADVDTETAVKHWYDVNMTSVSFCRDKNLFEFLDEALLDHTAKIQWKVMKTDERK